VGGERLYVLISAMKREKADAPHLADKSSSVATLALPDEVFTSVDLLTANDATFVQDPMSHAVVLTEL
jgi:hypothetical protein